jgi:hypothetical protein
MKTEEKRREEKRREEKKQNEESVAILFCVL